MKRYSAEISIAASPQVVWGILAEAAGYPNWDPGIDHIEGRLAQGEKVKFFTKLTPGQAFAVKVTTFEPGRKMVFSGGMPFGLFKSVRTHSLKADEATGHTHFHTEEVFSGPLLPLFGKSIPDLTENFEQFSAGLKKQAESAG